MAETITLPNSTRNRILKVVIPLLSGILFFGPLLQNGEVGFSNGTNAFQTLIPILLLTYLLVFAVINITGLKLKTYEIVFISFVTTVFFVFIFLTGFQPNLTVPESDNNSEGENTASDELTESRGNIDTNGPTETVQVDPTFTENPGGAFVNENPVDPLTVTIFGFSVLFVLFAAVLIFMRNANPDVDVDFANELNYYGNYSHLQQSIIDHYREASDLVEGTFGRAPRWYSPTHFSDVVGENSSKLLASYFNLLTELYEKARFSSQHLGDGDVKEAENLYNEIKTLLTAKGGDLE